METRTSAAPVSAPSPAPRRTSRRLLFLCAGLIVAWALLIRRFGGGDVYAVLGPFAVAVVAVV